MNVKSRLENIVDKFRRYSTSKIIATAALATILSLNTASAQNTLSGNIYKVQDKTPKLARITVRGNNLYKTTLSDPTTGAYSIDNIPSGTATVTFETQPDSQNYILYQAPVNIQSNTTLDHPAFPDERWNLFDTTAIYALKSMTGTRDTDPNHKLARMSNTIHVNAHKTTPPDSISQPDWAITSYFNQFIEIMSKCNNVTFIQDTANPLKGIYYKYPSDANMPPQAKGLLGYTQRDGVDGYERTHGTIFISTTFNDSTTVSGVDIHETLQAMGFLPRALNSSSIYFIPGKKPPMQKQDADLFVYTFNTPIGYLMSGYIEDSLVTRDVTTGVSLENITSTLPNGYKVEQNYPNPFNPTTNIPYEIPKNSHVNVSVYDIQGKLVETLIDKQENAGKYVVRWNSMGRASGDYFFKFEATNGIYVFRQMQKTMLLK